MTVGYELPDQNNTRWSFEGELGGFALDGLVYDFFDDTLSASFVCANVRLLHYFNEPGKGIYLTVGGGVGIASFSFEGNVGSSKFEDSGVFVGQGFIGLGYAFNEHWRLKANFRALRAGEASDGDYLFRDAATYEMFDLGVEFAF